MTLLIRTLEYLRFYLFWTLDFFKGSNTQKHLTDIAYKIENYSSPKVIALRQESLKKILDHAVNTTDYYSKFKNYHSIKDFPVINKNIIRSQEQEFKSVIFLNKKTKTVSTSGSTSSALKISQNKNKTIRNTADSIYFGKISGFKIGYKLLYLRHWDDVLRKSPLTKFMQNIDELEVVNMNNEYISKIIRNIEKDASKKGWLGYPSGFELICKYLDSINSKPIKANIKSIITMSEGLNNYTKKAMNKYFKSEVVSRYSNMEHGIIAQQKKGSSDFLINTASFWVEIFKIDEDEPADINEPGRIVVTDLYNYAIPLIRYDTGDIGAINYNKKYPVLTKIEGRKADIIFNTKGEIVSSFIVANVVEYDGIIQGQLIQEEEKEYTLKLNVTNNFNQESNVIKEFKGYLGHDAVIKILYINEIPLLSSGKRKATINNYLK
ncbi:phenylacetate--CoA ligase family protein [Flavivirga algicola]|uniref:CoF synthetase n=1 Tax=Flavivirga algicola TaxID=2729136 RepID=A0ABX1RXA6_9FLAO|nr:CoF synthetase [Flavivirga algicola]NMH88217.1 CoF synthetase [Flavivirga algicola]